MSDAYYRERAARRSRILIIIAVVLISIVCLYFGSTSIFRDNCTGSFDRDPASVVSSFIEGVANSDADKVVDCWEHFSYFSLETGCSEICLSRIYGSQYQINEINVSEPYITDEGRANILATVMVSCPGDEETFSGEITLDGVASEVPWRHWKIIHSTFGGPISSPWCK